MPKVIKILGIIVFIIVGYVVWELKYNSKTNFHFYVLRQALQQMLFQEQEFTLSGWGQHCEIAYEYNILSTGEWDRKRRFEDVLTEIRPCEEETWQAIVVRKNGDTYQILINFKKGLEMDSDFLRIVKEMANKLSANVFDSKPVDIHMCDEFFNTKRIVISQRLLRQ